MTKLNERNLIIKYLGIIVSICLCITGMERLGWVSEDSIVPFFFACLLFIIAQRTEFIMEKRRFVCVFLTAFSFAFFTIFGSIRTLYQGSFLRIAYDTGRTFAGLLFLFFVFVSHAFVFLDMLTRGSVGDGVKGYVKNGSENKPEIKKHIKSAKKSGLWNSLRNMINGDEGTVKQLLILTLICFVCYLPLFLRFYPGSFGADSINQIRQAMHLKDYNNHLPVLSTWLIEIFYDLGHAITKNVNASLAFYTVFQMLITALTYAGAVVYLLKKGLRFPAAMTIFGVFALVPAFAMYAIYIHKDTPAADLLLILSIYLHFFATLKKEDKKPLKLHFVLFTILGILFMLFRSNHFYIYPVLIVLAALFIKNYRKELVPVMIVAFVIAALFKGPFLKSLGIRGADAAETLSMPLQMVSYTLKVGGEVSPSDKAFLDVMLPHERLAEVYSETSANPVKRAIRDEGDQPYLEAHKSEFMKLFLRVFIKNPAPCLIALTDHSKGYYCPKFTHPEMIMGTWENEFDSYTDSLLPEFLGERVYQVAQKAYDLYEKYLGCAMSFWAVLLLMFYTIYRGGSFIPFMPAVGVVSTFILASPNVGRFRYQYPVMAAAVLLFGITLLNCHSERSEES
ncbi:MAG: hypothetical protein IJM23_05840 [Lachnospiraceae bacterium]|nr:hypothetical protein [Lachnospiraceae bacterium]